MSPEAVERWKAGVLSPYCISGCEDNCCGRLQPNGMTSGDIRFIYGGDDPDLIKRLMKEKRVFREIRFLQLESRYDLLDRCPRLEENGLCSVHENPSRPLVCKTYPVFPEKVPFQRRFNLHFETSCDYVRNNQDGIRRYFSHEPSIRMVWFT
jgi:Fe-S-cluster containining protein